MKNIKKSITAIIAAATAVMCAGTAVLGSGTLGMLDGFNINVEAAGKIGYINSSGEAKTVSGYNIIKSSTTKLTGGYYVVEGKVQLNNRLIVSDDSYLILTDGAKLIAPYGIRVHSGVKFNVYSQQDGTGALYAGTTNGSKTTADDGDCGIGGSGAKIYIVGGNVYAKGGSGAYGIQGSDIRLYWTNPTDSVYASSYSTSVQIFSAFADEESGAAYYSSKVSASALKGVTLKAANVVDKNTITMEDGIYAVFDDVKISNRMNVYGDVELFLADGGKLTADEGISVLDGNTLDIYGNGGKLYAGTRNGSNTLADDGFAGIGGVDKKDTGSIRVYGGIIYANGGKNSPGIGGNTSYVEINGGKVTATGGRNGAGIGSCYGDEGSEIKILGGNVYATGGINGAGISSGIRSNNIYITLSYNDASDSIYASSYNGNIKFAKKMYTSDGKVADTSNIDGKTISGTIAAYTVYFETNGGSYAAPVTVAAGSKLGSFPNVTKPGYTLEGWYTDRNLYNRFSANSAIYGNITLYAKWTAATYTVYFETNGGSYISPKSVVPGRTLSSLPTPTKDGYSFDGWYTDRNCYYSFNPNTPINGDITLYAKWAAGTYTVTFNAVNGWFPNGKATVKEQVKAGYSASSVIPADPEYADGYSNYEFLGWYYDKNGNTPYVGQAITKNTTLYAYYTKVASYFQVSFNANGGTFGNGQKVIYRDVDAGRSAYTVAPNDPAKENCTFLGWYYDTKGQIPYNGEGILVNTDLYACYSSPAEKVGIAFECNGGTQMSNMFAYVGDNISVTDLPFPTRDGYTFDGWYTNPGLTRRIYDYYTVTGPATLYAGWTPITVQYCRIYFVTYGGSGAATQTYVQGDIVSARDLPTPTLSGYKFAGWYTDDGLYNKFTSMEIVDDVTLYASWDQDKPASHIVRFYVNGSVLGTQEVKDGSRAFNAYSDYTWTTGNGREYNFNDPVYDDIDLYGTVATKYYTVKFYIDNSLWETQTVEANGYIEDKYNIFITYDWMTEDGLPFRIDITPITKDMKLYAYSQPSYTGTTFGGAGLIAAIAGGALLVGGGITAAVVVSKKKKNNK